MMEMESCQKEILLSSTAGAVCRCRCGLYHIRIQSATHHLSPSQFEAVARLFKLALGMSAGQDQRSILLKEQAHVESLGMGSAKKIRQAKDNVQDRERIRDSLYF